MRLAHLVARARNGVIGRDGGLPWHISADLRRFKALTMGKVIIMGRKTYDSIGKPLPGRYTIVLSRDDTLNVPTGVRVVPSVAAALSAVTAMGWPSDEVFIVGGGEVYSATMAQVDRIYLTEVHCDILGDAYYPELPQAFRQVSREDHEGDPSVSFTVFER